jgi:hypothetical protein
MSFIVSVRLEQLGSRWIDFHEIWYLSTFWKSVKNIQGLKSDKIMGAFHEDLRTHRSSRMWNVSDKSCRKNQSIYFMFTNCFSENHAVYGIMWKNTEEQDSYRWQYNAECAFNIFGYVHCKYIPIYIQQDATLQFLYIWTLLYMFRVVPPPITRSAYNCIWY